MDEDLRTLFAWQRRRGRALGVSRGQAGAVTFVQRFGGALNLNPHLHSIVPDGLSVSGAEGGKLRFAPLPAPATAEVEELTATIAGRLTDRLAAASEDRGNYLDPDLAALVEALFWSRNAPPGMRDIPRLPGIEISGREEDGLPGKPLCASVAPFEGTAGSLSTPLSSCRPMTGRRWRDSVATDCVLLSPRSASAAGPTGRLHIACAARLPPYLDSSYKDFVSNSERATKRSDCSRISDLCVEPRGLRAMMEFARGVPIGTTTLMARG